ncbi:MAG: SDR family oxidoreductase [Promethearchaeota archaeon]
MSKLNTLICMITGANAGIGKATAIQLAKQGLTIIMVCRNKERGEKAREEIREKSGNNKIDLFIADLGSLKSIREMVNEFKKKYSRLNILINNAGVFLRERHLSTDGYELTFAVNYLGHFLLTDLLLNVIKNSAPARIINVSSDIHKYMGLNFGDLMLEKKYKSQIAYGASKEALVLYTYELARKLEGTDVTVNALHPGHVKTKMMTEGVSLIVKLFSSIFSFTYNSPQESAQTSVYLAVSPEVKGVTGKYFKKCKQVKSGKHTYDLKLQKKLREISKKLVERK